MGGSRVSRLTAIIRFHAGTESILGVSRVMPMPLVSLRLRGDEQWPEGLVPAIHAQEHPQRCAVGGATAAAVHTRRSAAARHRRGRRLLPPPPSLPKSPFPRPSPQGTPEALPSPILRHLSSTRQSHASPASAVRRLDSGLLRRGCRGARGAPQAPWVRRGRWRGVLGSVLPVPAQNAVYSSYPPRITTSSSRL